MQARQVVDGHAHSAAPSIGPVYPGKLRIARLGGLADRLARRRGERIGERAAPADDETPRGIHAVVVGDLARLGDACARRDQRALQRRRKRLGRDLRAGDADERLRHARARGHRYRHPSRARLAKRRCANRLRWRSSRRSRGAAGRHASARTASRRHWSQRAPARARSPEDGRSRHRARSSRPDGSSSRSPPSCRPLPAPPRRRPVRATCARAALLQALTSRSRLPGSSRCASPRTRSGAGRSGETPCRPRRAQCAACAWRSPYRNVPPAYPGRASARERPDRRCAPKLGRPPLPLRAAQHRRPPARDAMRPRGRCNHHR